MKKKNFIILILILILIMCLGGYLLVRKDKNSSLPKPELTGGERGKLGIDKNINEKTLDNYLDMLEAEHNWIIKENCIFPNGYN